MLKLKLQYFGHLMWRADSFEKTLMLGGIEGRRRSGWQRMRWLDGITWLDGHGFGWTLGVGDGQGGLACCGSWGRKESDTTERLNWTEWHFLVYLAFFTLNVQFLKMRLCNYGKILLKIYPQRKKMQTKQRHIIYLDKLLFLSTKFPLKFPENPAKNLMEISVLLD